MLYQYINATVGSNEQKNSIPQQRIKPLPLSHSGQAAYYQTIKATTYPPWLKMLKPESQLTKANLCLKYSDNETEKKSYRSR